MTFRPPGESPGPGRGTTPPGDEILDDLVRLAATVADTPIALITVTDDGPRRLKAATGLNDSGLKNSGLNGSGSGAPGSAGSAAGDPDVAWEEAFSRAGGTGGDLLVVPDTG